MPGNSYILAEATTHSALARRYLAKTDSFFNALYGGLGMGIGAAAGVKLALPDRTVVLMIGDGSFYYNPALAGLGVCQEYNLPILIFVFNNGIYSAMRGMHLKYYPDGCAVRENKFFGVDMAPPADFSKVAEAFDAHGERLDDPNEIEPAIKRALEQMAKGRSALIDVVLDPFDTGGYAAIGGKASEKA